MKHPDAAWLTIAGGVVTWNVTRADDADMLSSAAHRYVAGNPVFARAVIAAVALHLMDVIPERVDPIHWGFAAVKWMARRIVR